MRSEWRSLLHNGVMFPVMSVSVMRSQHSVMTCGYADVYAGFAVTDRQGG